jgi:alpha-mannosidase
MGFSQPLLPAPARGEKAPTKPLLRLDSPDVLVTALKPSDDGQAIIVRLFGASGKNVRTKLAWARSGESWLSDTSEKALEKVQGAVTVPAWGVVTLRVTLDK